MLPGGLKGAITLLMLWTTRGHYNSSPLATLAAAATCLPSRHGLASMSSWQTGKQRYFTYGYCQLVGCDLICGTRSKKGSLTFFFISTSNKNLCHIYGFIQQKKIFVKHLGI